MPEPSLAAPRDALGPGELRTLAGAWGWTNSPGGWSVSGLPALPTQVPSGLSRYLRITAPQAVRRACSTSPKSSRQRLYAPRNTS